ncbi:MAG: hypothetical protein AABW89_01520 [Nanoarchaeota archaeon]
MVEILFKSKTFKDSKEVEEFPMMICAFGVKEFYIILTEQSLINRNS